MSAPTKPEAVEASPSINGRSANGQAVISNGEPVGISSLQAGRLWHASAPDGLRSSWKEAPHTDAWKRIVKLLKTRRSPKPLRGGVRPAAHPLQWGATPDLPAPAWRGLIAQDDASDALAAAIDGWVKASRAGGVDAGMVLESLWWAYELPSVAAAVDSPTWWRLVDALHEVAAQAIDASLGESPTGEAAFAQQALGGELPLVLGRQLGEAQPLRRLRKPAAAVLTDGVLALTDGEGMPTANVLDRLPLLLACWTRCRAWAEDFGKPCWSSDAETQYEWLVRQTLRLSRGDGTLTLTPADSIGGKQMLDLAIELAGDVSDNAAAGERLGGKAYQKAAGKAEPPEPSVNSEWSALSVLAADWPARSHRATVSYADRSSRLEYAAGGSVVFSGEWRTEVRIDGKLLTPVDDWEEQCWFSDDDCDYLELGLELESGAKLERQILVAREDRVAFLSDIVRAGGVQTGDRAPRQITLITRLPLAAGVRFAAEDETRDGWLTCGDRQLAGVVPAGLPEWRVDPRGGDLTEAAGELVLTHTQQGRNLCSPLFLDAAPTRFAKQRTWRQLTVAEALQPVGHDVAVGYRFQSGKDQWIAYRSLDKPANRTLIGHNLASECLFGRFLPTGEVDEFFEIEDV